MPDLRSVGEEIQQRMFAGQMAGDLVRNEAIEKLHVETGRNIIVYYSAWLQKPPRPGQTQNFIIVDLDKNGFMTTCHGLNRDLGLDLLLHTPGGDLAATESLVDYLHQMFSGNIRVVVPQLAMSAGTMIACSAKSIVMGKQSSLGPIDPQLGGIPAHGLLEEFTKAKQEITNDPKLAAVWQPIINKYQPTLVGEAQKAIKWGDQIVRDWLLRGMLSGKPTAAETARKILQELGDHSLTLSHARHISADKCIAIGLVIERLEANQTFQDAVLTVHHSCMHTLTSTPATKIIQNHIGAAYITTMQPVEQNPQKS